MYNLSQPNVFLFYYIGDVQGIVLQRDKHGFYDDWFVEHISVAEKGKVDQSKIAHFPLNRWMPANKPMQFEKFDSQLPQVVKAKNPEMYKQREEELKGKREAFNYAPIGNVDGMPRSVSY